MLIVMKMFYGLYGEDRHLYENYFKDKTNGVFCELGAVDGVNSSNTKYFEDYMGWTGFLIEPDPLSYAKLEENRPNSIGFNYAISSQETELDMLISPGVRGISSMTNMVSKGQVDKWHKTSVTKKVKATPIRNLITPENCTHLDLFCIDVEGSEYEVLKTFNWDIPVHYILIEFLDHFPEYKVRNDMCREFLKEKGFKFLEEVGMYDSLYVNPNYSSQ